MPEKYFEQQKKWPPNPDLATADVSSGDGEIEPIPEKLLPSGPRLAYMRELFNELRQSENDVRWQDLYKEVGRKPNSSMLELSDNIREVVRNFVAEKIPALKEHISAVSGLTDNALLDALTHNWFEEADEQVEGQRRQVLLAVGAHIIKRIETLIYKKILASPETNLENLGVDPDIRDLLIEILDTSIKSDPLFIRFLAFAQESAKPPKNASATSLFIPGDKSPHTVAELFPHEAGFLARRFAAISEGSDAWIGRPGGEDFKKYLDALAAFYGETDPVRANANQAALEKLYTKVVLSDFPILLTTGFDTEKKPPYIDPEMRVSLKSRDTEDEQKYFENLRNTMADSLSELGAQQFSDKLKKQPVRIVNVLGNYGVNLTFSAVAQSDPIILFLNEQIRQYDRDFPDMMRNKIKNSEKDFSALEPEQRVKLMEKISRTNSILHELSHTLYPDENKEAKRLGIEESGTITEVKAEIAYRPLIPSFIKKGAIEGTEKQWAGGMLASSLQILKDQPEDDDYYRVATYSLNRLFEEKAIVFNGRQLEILDYDAYYRVQKSAAQEVLALYKDANMNERKSAAWIKDKCLPNDQVRKLSEFLKSPAE